MSNLALVADALSLIGVLPEGGQVSAEQGELALRIANELVDEWADDGIVLSWSPATTLQDDCPLMGAELAALKYGIAVRLCPHFGRDPAGTLALLASGALTKLVRQTVVKAIEAADPVLPVSEGYRWYLEPN